MYIKFSAWSTKLIAWSKFNLDGFFFIMIFIPCYDILKNICFSGYCIWWNKCWVICEVKLTNIMFFLFRFNILPTWFAEMINCSVNDVLDIYIPEVNKTYLFKIVLLQLKIQHHPNINLIHIKWNSHYCYHIFILMILISHFINFRF